MESTWWQQRPPSADLGLVTQTGLSQRKFKNQETRTIDIRIFGSGRSGLRGLVPEPRSGLVRKETDYLLLAQEETFSQRWGAHMSSAFPPFAKHTVTCLIFDTVLCLTPSDWSNISERHLMPVEKADADPRCWRIDTIYKKVLNDRSKHVGQVALERKSNPHHSCSSTFTGRNKARASLKLKQGFLLNY